MWLRFETGFLGGVEGAIEDVYAALGIRFIAIGPVWSKSRADFLDVVRGRRLAIEIPSSKLNTHDWSLHFRWSRWIPQYCLCYSYSKPRVEASSVNSGLRVLSRCMIPKVCFLSQP